MPSILQLTEFTCLYGEKVALKNISLTIKKGEKVALIGPSGAGKTTLLKELFTLTKLPKSFVPQAQALVTQLSLFHNVYMGALDHYCVFYNLLNLLFPQKLMKEKMMPTLQNLGISQRLTEPMGSFSGGEQQRAAIARALFRKAEVLLADEPVSSLDPVTAAKALDLIFTQRETVVVSLHSVELALAKAKRIIGIKAGQIQFDLESTEVTQSMLDKLYQ
ncbi:MAG: ATP-binding cassette domain-containing protein [SAR324 cluster bacterium]|nr:ATP-binding cassette domain-containing protein [SAR324 cluster bacterium]